MKRSGLTIVELLLVMSLISLLSSIVFVSFHGVSGKTRIAAGLYLESSVYNGLGAEALALLEFDEGSGASVVEDISGYNNYGTVHGPSFSCASEDLVNTPSGRGCSLEFNGVDNYVEIPNSNSLNPKAITATMWLYLREDPNCNAQNNWRSIFYKGSVSTSVWSGYDLVLEQARNLTFSVGTSTGAVKWASNAIDGNNVPIDEWAFVAVAYNPSITQTRIYINGRDVTRLDRWMIAYAPNGGGDIASNSNVLRINHPSGQVCPARAGNFPGKIDNFRIYGEALSRATIEQMYVNDIINRKILAKNYNSLLDF